MQLSRPRFGSLAFRSGSHLLKSSHFQVHANGVSALSRGVFNYWHNHSKSRSGSSNTKPKVSLLTTTALIFSGIEPDEDPNGKTRCEKMLELSRKQLDDELDERRKRAGPVISWLSRYIIEPLLTWLRFFHLLAIISPIMLGALPIALGIAPHRYKSAWYKSIVVCMQIAGPSFIKLGQWAASRSDVFPFELCEQLSKLHSDAKRHSLAYTKKVVSESFGKPFEECFAEFDDEPLGIGAMAQVYRARYVSDEYQGDVAVKVLHPNVETTITRDLKIIMTFANLINSIPTMEWLSLPGEAATFGSMMQSQLDLRLEAQNLCIFNDQFAKDKDVSFPQAYLNVCTRQLLVEQMVEGVSMEKVLKYCQQNEFDKKVAALGLDAFLKMLLLNNFIHSDLHAGNIFLSLDGPQDSGAKLDKLKAARTQEEWNEVWQELASEKDIVPHLWFIDAGLVTELNPTNRVNFVELFKAIAMFDGYKAGELMVEKSRTPDSVIDSEVFCLKTERLVNQVKKRTFALGSVSIGDLLTNMMDMVRRHHVRMESDFITVVISILLLEGIGRRLDPDLDIFKSSLPVLRKVSQHHASNMPMDLFSMEDMLQMLKVWLVLETRQFITASVNDIYLCVKYDRLSPNN